MNTVKPSTLVNILMIVAFIFGIYVLYCFWMIQDEKNYLWGVLYGALLSVFLVSSWGMMKKKNWALLLSYVFMLVALALGVYLVHFAWTFWIFKEPTAMERIISVSNPRISAFIILPAIWFKFFSRKENKAAFHP